MELSALKTAEAHQEGAEMRVLDEFGNETDFYILLAGMDSDVWRNKSRSHARRAYKAITESGEYNEEEEKRKILTAATLGWRGLQNGGMMWSLLLKMQ